MHSNTLGMTVENTGFLVDRLGQDCGPLQYIRELTQNSIEAILKLPNKSGEIVWDFDHELNQATGSARKLCIVDTGIGMTGEEQLQFINKLSSSDSEQSIYKNFGVGAKIAGVTRNHAGLIYLSWKDSEGSMLHLWRDPATQNYGAKQFPVGGDAYAHFLPLNDEIKPPMIGTHGTKVVLLGNSENQDTTIPPLGTRLPTKWLRRYLNSRYFTFPPGITLRVREAEKDDLFGGTLREVTGQKAYLEKHSVSSGTVELSNAKAHWWILDQDMQKLRNNYGHYANLRHVAALYQNELYELIDGSAATARLQHFGIILGHDRIVLYLEPNSDNGQVSANTARTELLMDSLRLPWADWALEFRQNIPKQIRDLIEGLMASIANSNHEEAVKDRLKRLKDLFEISKYRPTSGGKDRVDEFDTPGGTPGQSDKVKTGSSKVGGAGGTVGEMYALFAKEGANPAEEFPVNNLPSWQWISVKDGTRQPDELEDRAARFIETSNLIQINADFRVFQDMIERWHKKYSLQTEARVVVESVVREWFEQQIVECVLGVLSIKNSARWNIEQVRVAWSEEALTTAVMSRYHVDYAISRALGQKLGALEKIGVEESS